MFECAARKFFDWTSSVGGGSPTIKGKLHGMGCVLDKHHTITAYHCWSSIASRYKWPVVFRSDGIFRCEVVFKSIDNDIAILRSKEPIEDRVLMEFNEYPIISEKPFFLGSTLGFMSSLTLYESVNKKNLHTHFAMGVVSMLLPSKNSKATNYVMSSTVIQKGFSGSAVFRPDGGIVGIIIETLSFRADIFNTEAPLYVLPVVSSIWPLIDDIKTILIKT